MVEGLHVAGTVLREQVPRTLVGVGVALALVPVDGALHPDCTALQQHQLVVAVVDPPVRLQEHGAQVFSQFLTPVNIHIQLVNIL